MTLSVQSKRLQAGFQSFTAALLWVLHLGQAHRPLFQNVGSLKTDVLLHPALSESHLRSRLPRTATISHSAHRVPVSNFGVRKPLFSVQTKAESPSSLRPNPSGQAHGATCHFLVSATGERGKEQWAGRGQVPAGPQMPRAPPWVGDGVPSLSPSGHITHPGSLLLRLKETRPSSHKDTWKWAQRQYHLSL